MSVAARSLLFFAVPQEAGPLRRRLAGRPQHRFVITGIGPRKALAAARRALAEAPPAFVLTCGFAGGLSPSLPRGTVVWDSDDDFPLRSALGAAAVPARFHCADRILVTAAEKATARRQTGADVVEMESEIIRSVARQAGVPSATVRVVSDAAGEDLPLDFNRLSTADFDLSYARLAFELVRRPGKIVELVRFQRALKESAERLATALFALLSGDG